MKFNLIDLLSIIDCNILMYQYISLPWPR